MAQIYQIDGQSVYDDKGKTINAQTGQEYVSPFRNPNADFNYGADKPPAPTPTPTPPSPTPDYTPRYTPEAPAPVQAETEQQIFEKKQKTAQSEIDNLNRYYDSLLSEQRVVNEGRERGTSAISTLTGLAGSTEANVQAEKTAKVSERENATIQNERAVRISGVLSAIRNSSVEEARQSRLEARQSTQDITAFRTKQATEGLTHLQNLAQGGTTFEGFKATDPQSYEALRRQLGNISDAEMKGLFVKNIPQDQVLHSYVENGSLYIAYKNPITGATRIVSTQMGVPAGMTEAKDMGDQWMFYEKGNPQNNYFVSKGISPEDKLKNQLTQEAKIKEGTSGLTGNIKQDADTIMSGTSSFKLTDLSVKDNYRAKVAAELDKRKKEALASGDFSGVIRASAGGKDVDTTFLQAFEKGINVVYQVGDLQAEIKNEITGPILGTLRSVNPYDVKARLIKAQLTAITPNLARGIYGEVGVLTDNDIKLYSQTLPTLKNPEDVRNAILGMTVRSLQRSLENKIKVQAGFGRDVSGIENVYLEVKKLADNILNPLVGATKEDLSKLDFKFGGTENTGTENTKPTLNFPMGDISLTNSLSGLNFKF